MSSVLTTTLFDWIVCRVPARSTCDCQMRLSWCAIIISRYRRFGRRMPNLAVFSKSLFVLCKRETSPVMYYFLTSSSRACLANGFRGLVNTFYCVSICPSLLLLDPVLWPFSPTDCFLHLLWFLAQLAVHQRPTCNLYFLLPRIKLPFVCSECELRRTISALLFDKSKNTPDALKTSKERTPPKSGQNKIMIRCSNLNKASTFLLTFEFWSLQIFEQLERMFFVW